MLSRALISYVRFDHPQTIMHPILAFSLDLLWDKLALRYFLMDRVLTVFNCIIFILSECILSHPSVLQISSMMPKVVFGGRCLVYTMGFLRLVYWHTLEICNAYRHKALSNVHGVWVPQYLTRGAAIISFILTLDMLAMMTVEPLFHCMGQGIATFECNAWTDTMSLTYEVLVTIGVFLYVMLIVEVGSISIKLSEYRVLCIHAVEQILLCLGVVFLVILTFAFAISGMDREVQAITGTEWTDLGSRMNTLIRLAFGAMDLGALSNLAGESVAGFGNPTLHDACVQFLLQPPSFAILRRLPLLGSGHQGPRQVGTRRDHH